MGGIEEGLEYSSEVAKLLRLSLVNKIVAEKIGDLIKSEEVFQLIDAKLNDVEFTNNNPFGDEVVEDLQVILGEIRDNNFSSDKYLSLIADENNLGAILWILSTFILTLDLTALTVPLGTKPNFSIPSAAVNSIASQILYLFFSSQILDNSFLEYLLIMMSREV